MSTNSLSVNDIKRGWHQVDAKGQILGRLATDIATILMGKKKANFVPYLDSGDFVVVVNAKDVKVTGKKENEKVYFRHSGYPGGDKTEVLKDLRVRRPEEIIRHAVAGMIPKTKLGKKMLKKLHVYPGLEHPYQNQLRKEEEKKVEVV